LFSFSLAEKVSFGSGTFQRKVLSLRQGEPLPATFKFKNDRFVFVVERDLTVTFNMAR
jgi:hypothetical protein